MEPSVDFFMQRRQFPMMVCCAMMINKIQRNTEEGFHEMAAMSYLLLKEVHDGEQNQRIHSRVARLWEHRDDKKYGLWHICLCSQATDPKFQPLLEEDGVYYFQCFKTSPISRPFCSTFHNCDLRFTSWTRVTVIVHERDDFPVHAYKLRPFKNIIDTAMDKTYLADVVGLINEIYDIATFDGSDIPKTKRINN